MGLHVIDQALAELDDWELFVALHRHEQRWDGLLARQIAAMTLDDFDWRERGERNARSFSVSTAHGAPA